MSAKTEEKLKRTCLSIETKLEIVKKIKLGCSQSKIADEYGIGKATVRDQDKYFSFVQKAPTDKIIKIKKNLRVR